MARCRAFTRGGGLLLRQWDERITQALQVDRGHPLHPLAVVGAHVGDGPLWIALWGLGLWYYWGGDAVIRRGILLWVLSSILGTIVTYSIKFVVRRQRPREVRGFYSRTYDAHAFPSGHATRMGTVALWGSSLFPAWAPLFWAISLWCVTSRAALGVHYVGDVVAGFLIGALTSLAILRWWH